MTIENLDKEEKYLLKLSKSSLVSFLQTNRKLYTTYYNKYQVLSDFIIRFLIKNPKLVFEIFPLESLSKMEQIKFLRTQLEIKLGDACNIIEEAKND